jgi:DNA (cytosine-5)-methyltransferase 1
MSKYDVSDEIMVDNFAGGGGASTGMSMATGKEIDIAINHNAEALAMHEKNHPGTKHFCESVFDVDPMTATKGRPVGLVWLSPDCRHHSKAKGGKPREQGIRGLAWIALRWAVDVRPRQIMLENVVEFKNWCGLDEDGRPIKSRSGETFQAFVSALSTGLSPDHPVVAEIVQALGDKFPLQHIFNGLGYKVEYKELRASDFGAPTIRKRLFLVARRDGEPIRWPEPTHGDPKKKDFASSGLLPWKTAAECIDWNEPTTSIFDRKRPLALNTMRRIAKGIKKFVLDSPAPFIVSLPQASTPSTGGSPVVQPFLAKFRGDSAGASLQEPMPTITSGGDAKRPAGSPHALGLVAASMTPFLTEHANSSTQRCFAADEPLRTQCANVKGGHFSLITPTLIQTGYGERAGQEPRALDIQKPLGTVVAGSAKHALVTASLTTFYGDKSADGDGRGASLTEPLRTQTTENRHGLVLASISKFRNNSPGSNLLEPLDTVAAAGQHHGLMKLSAVHMEQANGGGYSGDGRPITAPVSTIMGTGSHQQLVVSDLEDVTTMDATSIARRDQVRAFSKEFLGLEQLLVKVGEQIYEIVEIGLRMLIPRELFKAQGFPDGYIIEFQRNGKKLSKSAQVRMCGNSVAPPVAEALVRANMGQTALRLKKAA